MRLEETFCHSNSSKKPSANTDVKNSKGINNNNNHNDNNNNNNNNNDNNNNNRFDLVLWHGRLFNDKSFFILI